MKSIVAEGEGEGVHIDKQVQVLEQSGHDHDHEVAEVKEEQPIVEPDVQEGSDIEQEEQVQIHVQRVGQSDAGWGYSESVGHVQSVEPGLDVMQRYLEDSGP